jgi:hypothetical protein
MHDLKHLKDGNFGIDAKRQTLYNIYYQKNSFQRSRCPM